MCLILCAYQISDKYPLVIAANRDEFYERPTSPIHFWDDQPSILAGRDLQEKGTWLGFHKNGRFAALTNYRDPSSIKTNAPSRGEIIVDFLHSKTGSDQYLERFKKTSFQYNGFNLLLFDRKSLFWFSNITNKTKKIKPGIFGISNHLFDNNWPKMVTGKKDLASIIKSREKIVFNDLFSLLDNREIPHDSQLPDTGIGIEWERILSPLFITSPGYGTRSSSAVIMDKTGHLHICERTFDPKKNNAYTDRSYTIGSV